ncbi:hypothetical protein HYV10_01365 [Candidatus Dependentiae bacterium]|nr:hypothetical protein [Candidatus Dependentiae bacterium]
MKSLRIYLFIIFSFFFVSCQVHADSSIDTFKGIWSSIKSFPLFKVSFWKGIGQGFGAPPTGYVYSFMVHNDTDQTIWIATQNLASVMGGVFPVASGWDCDMVSPYTVHGQDYKEYYFELFIKTTPKSYSNHMPYLQHDDVLYQTEKINLIPGDKNSQHRNHFRVYMGKDFSNGSYKHSLKSEYIGYENIVASPKDENAISISSNLPSLTIKNSTDQDYYIGFTTQNPSSIKISLCQMVGLLEHNSFGLLSVTGSIQSLRPGLIGIFKDLESPAILTMKIPGHGFDNFSYTLEIYQDVGQQNISCQWQGITPGHYDVAVNRVKDITPIIGCLWYQSVAQLKGKNLIDLPGTVWVVSIEKNSKVGKILGAVQPGQVLTFNIERPKLVDKKEIYFLYVNQADTTKVQSFLNRFLSGEIGSDVIKKYQENLSSVIPDSALQLNPLALSKEAAASSNKADFSQALINQIVAGSFDLSRGQIVDSLTDVTGFLLGYDIFLPLGIGAGPFYYVLYPSYTANQQTPLPISAIENLFVTAPKGMPSSLAINTYAPTAYAMS